MTSSGPKSKLFEDSESILFHEQHLIPIEIKNKEEYFLDLWNIVNSWSGRKDIIYSNIFFVEAQNLITNAIILFEKGFFDCAFYSLRQSIEVSLTIAFFADNDNSTNQSEWYKKWMNKEKFPQQFEMIQSLGKLQKSYADVKTNLAELFKEIESVKRKMNKYIHKQGYDTFYKFKNEDEKKVLCDDFVSALNKSITSIALHRLVIDPMPILLGDDTIYEKTGDTLTEPFSERFIKKYLGDYVVKYKETELYKEYYNYYNELEAMNAAVLDLIKNNYFNREKFEEIGSQIHLLEFHDRLAVAHFVLSNKISQVYFGALGLLWYFSDVKSFRVNQGFESQWLDNVKNSSDPINHKFQNVYFTYFNLSGEEIFLEHNLPLELAEIEGLNTIHDQFSKSMNFGN